MCSTRGKGKGCTKYYAFALLSLCWCLAFVLQTTDCMPDKGKGKELQQEMRRGRSLSQENVDLPPKKEKRFERMESSIENLQIGEGSNRKSRPEHRSGSRSRSRSGSQSRSGSRSRSRSGSRSMSRTGSGSRSRSASADRQRERRPSAHSKGAKDRRDKQKSSAPKTFEHQTSDLSAITRDGSRHSRPASLSVTRPDKKGVRSSKHGSRSRSRSVSAGHSGGSRSGSRSSRSLSRSSSRGSQRSHRSGSRGGSSSRQRSDSESTPLRRKKSGGRTRHKSSSRSAAGSQAKMTPAGAQCIGEACRCGYKIDSDKWKTKTINGKTYDTHPIGEGGTASVIHAYCREKKECVAIKEILVNSESKAKAKETQEAFQNEIRILRYFNGEKGPKSKGIIRLIDHAETPTMLTIVMELGKPTLKAYVEALQHKMHEERRAMGKQKDKIKKIVSQFLEHIAQLTVKLCDCLIELHKVAIHQDLKPANVVMIGDRPKLIDFGYSALFTDKSKKSVTHDGQFYGTYQYASPEQLADATYDTKVDIWTLGVLLYQMLFGFKEYPYEVDDQAFMQIVSLNYHWKREVAYPTNALPKLYAASNPALFQLLKKVIENCLQFEPANRMDAAHLKEMLQSR